MNFLRKDKNDDEERNASSLGEKEPEETDRLIDRSVMRAGERGDSSYSRNLVINRNNKLSRTWNVQQHKKTLRFFKRHSRRLCVTIIREAKQKKKNPFCESTLMSMDEGKGLKGRKGRKENCLLVSDSVIIRILKEVDSRTDDIFSSSDEEEDSLNNEEISCDDDDNFGWTEDRRQPLSVLKIHKVNRKDTVHLKWGASVDASIKKFQFTSAQDAAAFCSVIQHLKNADKVRSSLSLKSFRELSSRRLENVDSNRGITPNRLSTSEEAIKILIEVVSCMELPQSCDNPYVVVRMGDQDIHTTKAITHKSGCIWTVSTGSICLLVTSPEDFFQESSGLAFVVKNFDIETPDTMDPTIGITYVKQRKLLEGTGEREVHEIRLKKGKKSKLVLRYRRATLEDEKFMLKMKETKRRPGIYSAETYVKPKSTREWKLKRETREVNNGQREYRVKPGPDMKNKNQTTWLTEPMIDYHSLQPSQKWITTGSGMFGRLFVEIIGCDGLPNMDNLSKTDAFVCIVYEDCAVNTDVIPDVNSPRWMPWTQRAFIFHILHPSSQLFVGVFDYDNGDSHDPISRVTIDTTSLHPNTEYMLNYNLYTSALTAERKNLGRLTVRLRMEWNDQRKLLMSPLSLRPKQYINFVTKQDCDLASFAINGKYDMESFNTAVIYSYIDELYSYEGLIGVIRNAFWTVVLWRGHFPIKFAKLGTIYLPVHSIIAFCGAVLLVEDFELLPSFLLFSVAWFLFATMEQRRCVPSRWQRCPSYFALFRAFVFAAYPPHKIEVNESIVEIEKYEATLARKSLIKNEKAKAEEEMDKSFGFEEVDENAILGVKNQKMSLNPLKPLLFPLQQLLEQICFSIRVVSSVILWQECFQAFWIVTCSIFFGVLFVFVPWSFVIRWFMRIFVWVFLGPWMKLVDIMYFKGAEGDDYEKMREELRLKARNAVAEAVNSQVRKEDALKLKEMRKYRYGKYICKVPAFKAAMHFDYPLPTSSAIPSYSRNRKDPVVISERKTGQYLSGNIILTSDEFRPDE